MSAAIDARGDLPVPASGAAAARTVWIGRVVSALPILAMLASGAMKLSHAAPMVDKWINTFGWGESTLLPVALLEVGFVVLYLLPRTAVLGAILVTGYLGGAYASHLRIGEATAFAPILLGALVWLGLYLRDKRVRALLPLRGSVEDAR